MATAKKVKTAAKGQTVKVHYKGTLADGSVFDDSREREETLDFEIGTTDLLPAFQDAIVGMKVGETKSFTLASAEAYGDPDTERVVPVSKDAFPEGFDFVVGSPVLGTSPNGRPVQATITEVQETQVFLDHNHPLAGKALNFEVELVEVQ